MKNISPQKLKKRRGKNGVKEERSKNIIYSVRISSMNKMKYSLLFKLFKKIPQWLSMPRAPKLIQSVIFRKFIDLGIIEKI